MKIARVLLHRLHGIGDLIIDGEALRAAVFQCEARTFAEGYLPIAVKGRTGIDAHRQRGDLRILPPAAGKEITQRTLHGGNIAAVPIDAKDLAAPIAGGREPDMADHAAAFDLAQRQHFAGFDIKIRIDLPAVAQIPRSCLSRVFRKRCAPPPCPCRRCGFPGRWSGSDREEDVIDSCCSSVKPPFALFVGSAPTYPFHRLVSTRKGLDFFNKLTYHKIR